MPSKLPFMKCHGLQTLSGTPLAVTAFWTFSGTSASM